MILCVQCGAIPKHAEIQEVVESCTDINAKMIGKDPANPISLRFEVDSDDEKKAISIIEKAIKSSRHGRMISFRVVPDGSMVYYK